MNGTIARLIRARGFGFIKSDSGAEYFFHRSCCLPAPHIFNTLTEGDSVEFQIEDNDKGPRAIDVQQSLSR